MASTRLNNDPGWYCQNQRGRAQYAAHELWKYKCISNKTAFPCAGINMPMMTNGYNNGILSKNASDIESALFGIGATNLARPKQPVTPELKCIGNVSFFDRPQTYLPEPLIIHNGQRPIGPYS
jgi:hypothetical protein